MYSISDWVNFAFSRAPDSTLSAASKNPGPEGQVFYIQIKLPSVGRTEEESNLPSCKITAFDRAEPISRPATYESNRYLFRQKTYPLLPLANLLANKTYQLGVKFKYLFIDGFRKGLKSGSQRFQSGCGIILLNDQHRQSGTFQVFFYDGNFVAVDVAVSNDIG